MTAAVGNWGEGAAGSIRSTIGLLLCTCFLFVSLVQLSLFSIPAMRSRRVGT